MHGGPQSMPEEMPRILERNGLAKPVNAIMRGVLNR